MNYPKLFSPVQIGGLTIKNRIFMPAMMLGFADMQGNPTKKLVEYYAARAKGGVGLIITEITRVDDSTGASSFGQLSLSSDNNVQPMRQLVNAVHNGGAKIFVQLHHPGRQNVGLMVGTVPLVNGIAKICPPFSRMFWKLMPLFTAVADKGLVKSTVAPSKCPPAKFANSRVRQLSIKEIKKIQSKFVSAAVRAKAAGFDGIELHAAHGYLLQQFLSPYTNVREDEYGSSFENRARFIDEIIVGIKAACGETYPISLRLTVDECYSKIGEKDKGYDLNEGVLFASHFAKRGIAVLNVSVGGYDTFNCWLEPTSYKEGWRKPYIDAVSAEVEIPVIAVDNIRHAEYAEKELENGTSVMVGLGRQLIADAEWCSKVKEGKEAEVTHCISCLNCFESMQRGAYTGSHASCSVNPCLGHEGHTLDVSGEGRLVIVVGAGIAGLSAAFVLLKRGFRVTILEKSDKAGGQLNQASRPPFKEKIGWAATDLYRKVVAAGGTVLLNTNADSASILAYQPYAVVVATGGHSVVPKSIEQKSKNNVFTVDEILDGQPLPRGKRAVVVGSGMTGLEVADYLSDRRVEVTIVESAATLAPSQWFQQVDDILPRLTAKKVDTVTGGKVTSVTRDKVYYTKDGKTCAIAADYAVVCVGVRPVRDLCVALAHSNIKTYVVGDARKSGKIVDAVTAGYKVGLTIK